MLDTKAKTILKILDFRRIDPMEISTLLDFLQPIARKQAS